jgi:hypothetical protein
MSNIFKAMKAKKKRAVDPNAPPRPNLMTHDVKIRNQQDNIDSLRYELVSLKSSVQSLQNKLNNQTSYLQAVHSKLKNK